MASAEHDASERSAAEAFFEAVARGEASAKRKALDGVWPFVERTVRACFARHRSLAQRSGTTLEDTAQLVALRLVERPPDNPHRRPAEIVLRAWAITVVVRSLIDRRRRAREDPLDEMASPSAPNAEIALGLRRDWEKLEDCVKKLPERYARAFQLVREEPDLGALELAAALDLYPRDPELSDEDREQRARQNAWQLRRRTLAWLAECVRGDEP